MSLFVCKVLNVLMVSLLCFEASLAATNEERAKELLKSTPLIDGHNDVPYQIRTKLQNQFKDLTFDSGTSWHTDIPRLRTGQVGAQFWSAYISCKSQMKNAARIALEQIEVVHRLVERYPDDLALVTTAQEIRDAFKDGKIGSLIGLESGHGIDSSLGFLRQIFHLGVRADSCTPAPVHNGLTEFGKSVVREMNQLGMFVDISHVSAKTMKDVLEVSKAPVIFSHSSARKLCNHTRNVPDDVLEIMKQKDAGVVMVNFYSDFLVCSKTNLGTIDDVVDHINHIKNTAGIDRVGIGADYDGVSRVPVGLEDVSKYPKLIERLLERGYSDEDVKKIIGENLLREMAKMEQVAREMKSVKPSEEYAFYENVECRPNFEGTLLKNVSRMDLDVTPLIFEKNQREECKRTLKLITSLICEKHGF